MNEKRRPEDHMERIYRRAVTRQRDWAAFAVRYKQTDLWIQADRDLRQEAEQALLEARMQVEGYARSHPSFLTAHTPLPVDPLAPPLVLWMLRAGQEAGVGPMAAVAGAIAQHVGERLLAHGKEVVIENGGDLYLRARRPLIVGVFAGGSPLSQRVGLKVGPGEMPAGIGTSSATVGHSWSYGSADAACVLAGDAALADAAATAVCNRVQGAKDLKAALEWGLKLSGVRGVLVIRGKLFAVQGVIELVPLEGSADGLQST